MTDEYQIETARLAIQGVMEELIRLGIKPQIVLSCAHATAIGEIAAAYGGKVAAERCRGAAERCEILPSHDRAWAVGKPAGSA